MPSIFTRIVEREIPAHILREDSDYLAFLDVRPIRQGHTLVIPKAEVPDVFDLPEALLAGLLPFARPVAHAIQQVTQATRIGMAVIGLEVLMHICTSCRSTGSTTSTFVAPVRRPTRSSRRLQSAFGKLWRADRYRLPRPRQRFGLPREFLGRRRRRRS